MKIINKQITYDLFVEILAIFIGVFVAFYIDDIKDENQRNENVAKYFGMLKSELKKDVSTLQQNQKIIKSEYNLTRNLIIKLEKNQTSIIHDELNKFGKIDLFFPKEDMIETIIKSPDFVSIYDENVFSELNDLKYDCKIYDLLANKQFEMRDKILDQLITKEKIQTTLEYLKLYKELLGNKLLLNGSLITGYLDCIKTITESKK